MARLSCVGETELSEPIHRLFSSLAYAVESSPLVPSLFSLLISLMYLSYKKYWVSSVIWLRHWSPEFMKQVLPRFLNPTKPYLEWSLKDISTSYSSDSQSLGHRNLWWCLSWVLHFLEQYRANLQLQMNFSYSMDLQLPHSPVNGFLLFQNIQLSFTSFISTKISELPKMSKSHIFCSWFMYRPSV